VALDAVEPGGDVTLIVGAEREGLPDKVVAACDEVAHIPIRSESLNAGMAATVALYELDRRIRGHA
jgi:TrmH family RNA methyltransferase